MKKIVIFLSLILSISANQLKVPSQYSTIQAAIDAASAGDTVLVADGTYTENLNIDKDITIISENGAEKTIIDGGKITHVIGISSSTTRDCVLDGFTVTNGGGDDAGGIFVAGGSPILRNLIITGNRCEKWSGGGIDVIGEGANPLIEDCIITDNYATDSGGGLMVAQKATATIIDVTISNNTAEDNGGGISVWGGSIKIKDTILENNSAKYTGAMSIGTDDTLDFRPIIDIENVEVINQRDLTIEQMVAFSDCSLTVKNLSFSNIRTESSLGSFYNSYVNIENLSLKDIRDNGHSLLFIGSKGTVSGLTIERDTSRWAIAKIEQGSKIDFNNLKISNSKTSDFSGLFISGATVTIDTLDINNCNWKSHSISVDNSIFTLDNGKISNITAQEGSAGLSASSCNSIDVSNTIIDSSYSGAHGGMVFYQVKKVNIKNSSFIANRSVNGGGGIHVNEVDSLFLYNSTFIADSSQGGGAVELGGGKYYHLDGNVMENNYSADGAGAINLWDNDKVEIFNSKFISNKSVTDGGAIYSWNTDSLFIDNSTFNGNVSTDGNGGAMTVKGDENSTLYCEIKNTTFENNSGGWGGAIAAFEPINMNIDSVFATGNEASGNGSFIELCCGASVSITNSTIYNNETNNNDLSVPSGCKMTIKNSIIWKDKIGVDTDATIEVTYSDVEGGFTGTGNIDANPMFCDSWSGTWPQLAGNYHLTYLSPAIGSGENGVNMGAFDVGCDIDNSLLSVDELIDVTPTEYALHENYPNPFNPTTTLRFDLPEVSDVTLTIYNMLGQKVRTFDYQNTSAGYHSVKWNATNDYGDPVGAGMYLYQLRANQFVKTKKMVLLK